jgi:hypothetical protein
LDRLTPFAGDQLSEKTVEKTCIGEQSNLSRLQCFAKGELKLFEREALIFHKSWESQTERGVKHSPNGLRIKTERIYPEPESV